jgi:hypothetical protein
MFYQVIVDTGVLVAFLSYTIVPIMLNQEELYVQIPTQI